MKEETWFSKAHNQGTYKVREGFPEKIRLELTSTIYISINKVKVGKFYAGGTICMKAWSRGALTEEL